MTTSFIIKSKKNNLQKCGCRYFLGFDKNSKPELIPCKKHRINGETSDGYHTFNELYDHRHALFCALSKTFNGKKIKSKLHDDGTMYDGWFVAGVFTENGLIDYHLPIYWWDKFDGEELDRFISFDGHTPNDVFERLKSFEIKKEPKVYHAENCNEAVRGKFYEFFNYALDKWIVFKLKNIFPRTAMPFSPNDGGSFFPLIRECEQPEEKVREVTIEEIREKFSERYVSKNVFLSDEKDHACVMIDKVEYCCGLDNLFGEKVKVV